MSCLNCGYFILYCIEFQDSSPSNTHPVPRAMCSVITLTAMAEIPDGLCHILYTWTDKYHKKPENVVEHSSRFCSCVTHLDLLFSWFFQACHFPGASWQITSFRKQMCLILSMCTTVTVPSPELENHGYRGFLWSSVFHVFWNNTAAGCLERPVKVWLETCAHVVSSSVLHYLPSRAHYFV